MLSARLLNVFLETKRDNLCSAILICREHDKVLQSNLAIAVWVKKLESSLKALLVKRFVRADVGSDALQVSSQHRPVYEASIGDINFFIEADGYLTVGGCFIFQFFVWRNEYYLCRLYPIIKVSICLHWVQWWSRLRWRCLRFKVWRSCSSCYFSRRLKKVEFFIKCLHSLSAKRERRLLHLLFFSFL